MAKVFILINAMTSAGDPGEVAAAARRSLSGHRVQVSVPQTAAEFGRVPSQLQNFGADFVVVVGGDGTANHLLTALMKTQVPTYFFAGGTANDLASQLGHVPSWDAVKQAIAANTSHDIDVVAVNESYFVTVGGMGVGAVLTELMNQRREASPLYRSVTRMFSKHTYSLLALQVILGAQYRPVSFEMRLDDQAPEFFDSACVLIANQPFLAGDMTVSPLAKNTDGAVNLLVLRDTSRQGLILALVDLLRGKPPQNSMARSFKTGEFVVHQPLETRFFGDGEPLDRDSLFRIRVKPHALRVLQSGRMS